MNRKRWEQNEIDILKEKYPKFGAVGIMKEIDRSRQSVNMMASRLGVVMDLNERRLLNIRLGRESIIHLPGELNPNWKGGRSKNNYFYKKRMKEKYPEKHRAREIAYRSIMNGKLIKQPCVVCGNQKSEAHHDDYLKPLEVVWLCRLHHQERHSS